MKNAKTTQNANLDRSPLTIISAKTRLDYSTTRKKQGTDMWQIQTNNASIETQNTTTDNRTAFNQSIMDF